MTIITTWVSFRYFSKLLLLLFEYKCINVCLLIIYEYKHIMCHNLRNQHRLVLAILQHSLVGVVRNGEEMGRHLSLSASLVGLDDLGGVDGQAAVGVHSHAEQARVRLYGKNMGHCECHL